MVCHPSQGYSIIITVKKLEGFMKNRRTGIEIHHIVASRQALSECLSALGSLAYLCALRQC
jgi:hypothetical protein